MDKRISLLIPCHKPAGLWTHFTISHLLLARVCKIFSYMLLYRMGMKQYTEDRCSAGVSRRFDLSRIRAGLDLPPIELRLTSCEVVQVKMHLD
ncbi:unnamed protein product [Leptosia nina]|uniref:Uncharacterized protein n=1 Tax=Leptosia nina TaxID=320188 RepID=A0AAV1JL97_9NEOP